MTKFYLALAAGVLLTASPATAQSPATTYPTASGAVFTTPAYSSPAYGPTAAVSSDEATPVRRGLFARIRARREARSMPAAATYGPVQSSPVYTSSPYTSPYTTTTPGTTYSPSPVITPAPAATPGVPMQMPGRMSMMPMSDGWRVVSEPLGMPAGMQTVVVDGMTYQVPATLPPEGVVVSVRYVGSDMPMPGTGVIPVSGTVMPGMVTPATFSIPLRQMPMPR